VIAITGHTGSIGQEIYSRFNPDNLGFSLSNGYDITERASRKKIINAARACDVFINNAAAGYGQVDLLIELFTEWKDCSKLIVNVGSRIAEVMLGESHLHLLQYSAQKKALKSTVNEIQGYNCKVEYVWFAYVGTDKILAKYPHFTEADYISVAAAADLIIQPVLDYRSRNGLAVSPAI